MKYQKLTYPPLTPDDIRIIKGKPMVKIIPSTPDAQRREEWVYLSPHTRQEEHYFFRANRLVGWRQQ